jgi:hypothetical protein
MGFGQVELWVRWIKWMAYKLAHCSAMFPKVLNPDALQRKGCYLKQ